MLPQDFSQLEEFVQQKISETRTPSMSLAVVKNGKTIFAKGFGFRDIASGLPATPRTLYGIGSITKSFTALAIMQLVEKGKLSLNDPVEKYARIPAFGGKVTIHHLLTHSSGLPALGYAETFIRGALGMDDSWLPLSGDDEIVSFMKDAHGWVESPPGKRFFYLNEGWVLLGGIVSKVSKTSYVEYVRKYILKPLKMNRSFFLKSEVEEDSDRATPYIHDRDRKQIPTVFPYGVTADGGLISNVIDLANYLNMYLHGGKFNGETLLSRKLLEKMMQPHITVPKEFAVKGSWLPKDYKSRFPWSYGYGWITTPDFFGHTLIGHGGDVGSFTAYLGFLPEKDAGVAVLANPCTYPLATVGRYALAQAIEEDPEKLPFVKAEQLLTALGGEYRTYKKTITWQVKREGDLLTATEHTKLTDQTIPLIPQRVEEDYAEFYALENGVEVPVEFGVKNGKHYMVFERYKFEKTG